MIEKIVIFGLYRSIKILSYINKVEKILNITKYKSSKFIKNYMFLYIDWMFKSLKF
jgi:hypothetical protein